MAKTDEQIKSIFQSLPFIMKYPSRHVWIDYDKDADVLYLNFAKGQKATDSIIDGDVIRRERMGKVIGFTFLNASKLKHGRAI